MHMAHFLAVVWELDLQMHGRRAAYGLFGRRRSVGRYLPVKTRVRRRRNRGPRGEVGISDRSLCITWGAAFALLGR